MRQPRIKVAVRKHYIPSFNVLIANNDVMNFLKSISRPVFQLIVTSPPYNLGKPYEKHRTYEDYKYWQKSIIMECARVLKPGGSLCWQVGNYVKNGEVYPLDIEFYGLFKENPELHLRNRIVWFYEHGLHAKRRLSGRYETILWFTKGNEYYFDLDALRVKQKYPGKTFYKGPNRGKPSSNPLGKNPGDILNLELLRKEWKSLVWDIPNVKANHPEKTEHPSQFPIELVERLVLALTKPRQIVFDPFMGTGASLIAAILHGRKAIGVDIEKNYTDIALKRVKQAIAGKLKYRHLGTQKYVPTGKDKVSRSPF